MRAVGESLAREIGSDIDIDKQHMILDDIRGNVVHVGIPVEGEGVFLVPEYVEGPIDHNDALLAQTLDGM